MVVVVILVVIVRSLVRASETTARGGTPTTVPVNQQRATPVNGQSNPQGRGARTNRNVGVGISSGVLLGVPGNPSDNFVAGHHRAGEIKSCVVVGVLVRRDTTEVDLLFLLRHRKRDEHRCHPAADSAWELSG